MKTYIQRGKLYVWIPIVYSLLQGSHGLAGLYGFGADDIGDLQVQSYILSVEL